VSVKTAMIREVVSIARTYEGIRRTGIDIVGDVPWGTHLCQFYETKDDLIEILVPYLKAGLENNEFCMCVTSKPMQKEEARAALSKEVSNLDDYINKGQMEILDYSEWYTKSGQFHSDEVLQGWIDKEKAALENGFDGLRLSANTLWLERKDWRDFNDYEATVDSVIGNHQMLVMCTYSLEKCNTSDVIEVVSVHESALIRKGNKWQLIEDVERKQAKKQARESEERLCVFMEMAPDAFALFDSELNLVKINKAGLQMFPAGTREEDVIGKSVTELYPGIEETGRYEDYGGVIETGQPFFIDDVGVDPRLGVEGPAVSAFKIGDGLGLIVTDLTERKRSEEALRKAEDKHRGLLEDLHVEEAAIDRKRRVSGSNGVVYGVTGYVDLKTASQTYGLSEGRIRQLLRAKRLIGRKFGNAWAVSIASLENYRSFPQKAPKTKKRRERS